MEWELAPDIQKQISSLVNKLSLTYISPKRVFCFRSYGSKSRAKARVWSLPRIWQKALKAEPGYCIEVISEKYDKLSGEEQKQILIHELLHIPKTFSGSLLPHRNRRGKWLEREVKKLSKKMK
jgi:predicted metallopeptidase